MTGQQLAKHIGASYRQVDHWTTLGYLKARRGTANPGHGFRRDYTPREVEVAEAMAALVKQGVEPKVAARIGRRLVAKGYARLGKFTIVTGAPA